MLRHRLALVVLIAACSCAAPGLEPPSAGGVGSTSPRGYERVLSLAFAAP